MAEPPTNGLRAVVSDFGGVLTTPLFADIPVDMTADEIAIFQSTATFVDQPTATLSPGSP